MLRVMIFPLFLLLFSRLSIHTACSHSNACSVKPQEDVIQSSAQAVEAMKQSKEFQSFLIQSNQQRDATLEDKNFQEVIANLQAQAPLQEGQPNHQAGDTNQSGNLYIFVSFSMGEKALLNLAQEAKTYGATLILRGFKDNSYTKTATALQNVIIKTGQGFIIDPELFTLFGITVVPTYVLTRPFNLSAQERSQTPLHDRLQGHVSTRYALEIFAKEGELQVNARALLANASQEKRRHQ
jgi:type-F conjugative transfer system pilin assembly protein TrbC